MKDNIADHIQVEVTPDIRGFGNRLIGKHIVLTSIPMDCGYQTPPQEFMEDLVKAKIIAFFYGQILKDLETFRGKWGYLCEPQVMNDLTKIIDRIYEGRIIDNNELAE